MRAPAWLWGIVLAFAAFSVWSYGNARAAEALALARADSLAWAQEQHDSLEVERDSVRAALIAFVVARDRDRDSLRVVAAAADRRSRVNLGRLAAVLADTTAPVPDTVRIIVRAAIVGLEGQRDVCRAELRTCDDVVALLRTRITTDSRSLGEKDALLAEFQGQLEDAIANRRRPAGVLRWVERGLVAYAIIRLGTDLLGGGSP